jgi:hypothetical protein
MAYWQAASAVGFRLTASRQGEAMGIIHMFLAFFKAFFANG